MDVNSDLSRAQIEEIKGAVDKHRLVILPNQVLIPFLNFRDGQTAPHLNLGKALSKAK